MTNKIGIDVEANLDTSSLDRALDQIEQKIEATNRTQLDPVPDDAVNRVDNLTDAVEDLGKRVNEVNRKPIRPVDENQVKVLDAVNARFQQLLRVDGELRRRAKATGQLKTPFEQFDFSATHPDPIARQRYIKKVRRYLGMDDEMGPPPPGPDSSPDHHRRSSGFGQSAVKVAQAGLSAGGSIGKAASKALSSGMEAGSSGGLGAGLMTGLGTFGGALAALGLSKIVGGVVSRIDQAEDNNVAYDRLKRTLGDVTVSFDGLKTVVTEGAEKAKVSYADFAGLSTSFAKASNMQAGDYRSLYGDVGFGVGLSRSFGMNPSQGVGILGQMRGVGVSRDSQDLRRFALIIGETIGKSQAFSKAEEVFDAIGGYATSQARSNLGPVNTEGYAGMFSAMVRSGAAGLDPQGAASILARVNAALSAGGAKGEASQFFTARIGQRLGLDPLQTQIFREGGAFGTMGTAFGNGSAYEAYLGHKGPGGNTTFLEETRRQLEMQPEYAGGSDQKKLLRAQAFANHTGMSMTDAMRFLSISPDQITGMKDAGVNLDKLSGSGIASMAKAKYGSAKDREELARELTQRDDVKDVDKARISTVMAKGSEDEQKQLLAQIVAQVDQQRTTGSDIRDSKVALDNIKTSLADKLVPLTQEMRHGIMYIAGQGKLSSSDVMKKVVETDSDARIRAIQTDPLRVNAEADMRKEQLAIQDKLKGPEFNEDRMRVTYRNDPEGYKQKMKERNELVDRANRIEKEIQNLEDDKKELLKKENERRAKELADIDASERAKWEAEEIGRSAGPGMTPGGPGAASGSAAGPGRSIKPASGDKVKEAMDFFMSSEGGGWSREQASAIVANLVGESQLDSTAFNPAGGGRGARGQAQWRGQRISKFQELYGKDILQATDKEQWKYVNHELTDGVMKGVGDRLRQTNDPRAAGTLISKDYEIHGNSAEDAARGALAEKLSRGQLPAAKAAPDVSAPGTKDAGTPLPVGLSSRGRDTAMLEGRITAEPIIVEHRLPDGREYMPQQQIQTRLNTQIFGRSSVG